MKLAGLELRRRWQARKSTTEPYRSVLTEQLPAGGSRFSDLEILCLDLETTGLDPSLAEILSFGWVAISRNRVDIASARHYVVRRDSEVGDSASVHGLTDTMIDAGHEPGAVLDRLLETLRGRVLVVHHAGLDKALLDRACRARYGGNLHVPVIDTLRLEHRRRQRQHHVGDGDSLRLGALREHYHLPYYAGHDALADALATAELLLAMVASHDGADRTKLRDLV